MLTNEVTYPSGTTVLIWQLEEDGPQLLQLCRQAGIPIDDLAGTPLKRQRERAAERLLLCRALGQPVEIAHDCQGAPVAVRHEEVNISISHTMQLVALACCRQHVIGLDVESAHRQQVLKVRDKFLNASEKLFIAQDDLVAHVIAWTAKEAIIKAERNSALDWTEGIILQPFAADPGGTTLAARCAHRHYHLTSSLLHGHFVTLAIPVDR